MADPLFGCVVLTANPPGTGEGHGGSGHLTKIDGREALLKSVELFLNRDNVKQVVVAFAAAEIDEAKRKFGPHFSFSGVRLVSSSDRWSAQLASAAEKLGDEITHVIVHDAARPIVPYTDTDALLEAASTADAVALVAPVAATLIENDEGGHPMAYHAPSSMVQLLTPQVYARKAFDEMVKSNQPLHPSRLRLIRGSGINVRITPGEASIAKAMQNLLPKPKTKASSPFEEAQW